MSLNALNRSNFPFLWYFILVQNWDPLYFYIFVFHDICQQEVWNTKKWRGSILGSGWGQAIWIRGWIRASVLSGPGVEFSPGLGMNLAILKNPSLKLYNFKLTQSVKILWSAASDLYLNLAQPWSWLKV